MNYYVIGGFNGRVSKCNNLSEAKTLADELSHAVEEIEIAHPFSNAPATCILPVEIFTEEQWFNARRCG